MTSEITQGGVLGGDVAIIGMSGRFPGAPNLEEFWENLASGVESISRFSEQELMAAGISPEQIKSEAYVRARGMITDADQFDADAFDLSAHEASVMDPQFRIFLEVVWQALDNAGCAPTEQQRTGVFAGCGANTYQEYLREKSGQLEYVDASQLMLLNQSDFLSSWASYKLNLTGPCVTVQTACSTSLTAVHLASQSLLNGECDIAVAGGVSLSFPQRTGYRYAEAGLYSPDGHCRAFAAQAAGFVPSEGAGVVVLKRLEDAIRERHTIRAVIKGSAINNDGANKIGFSSPSQDGMATAIAESVAAAGVSCESIRMIEAHGAATTLGDPIEIAALTQVFGTHTSKKQFCAIGSVKTNIGHANAASGIASLIKAVLAIENRVIPPSLHCETSNPLLKLPQTPFYVNSEAEPWSANGEPRRAGVNSFGIGGSNVHIVLEESPQVSASTSPQKDHLLLLSARTDWALDQATLQLADYLERTPEIPLEDVAFILAVGRRQMEKRRVLLCENHLDASKTLREGISKRFLTASDCGEPKTLTFFFPDDETGYVNAASLYRDEQTFREHIDRCAEILLGAGHTDIRSLLQDPHSDVFDPEKKKNPVCAAMTVALQYSVAKLLIARGVFPKAVAGAAAGELAAACTAEMLPLETAMLLAARLGGSGAKTGCTNGSLPVTRWEKARIDFLPLSSGRWIRAGQTPDGCGWSWSADRGLSSSDALQSLLNAPGQAIVDLSAGNVVDLIDSLPTTTEKPICVAALPKPDTSVGYRKWLLMVLGRLWQNQVPVDWSAFYSSEPGRRVPLPAYPFNRQRYWVGELPDSDSISSGSGDIEGQGQYSVVRKAKYREPCNDLQAVVASAWAFHLGVDRVGILDSFFEWGGNSIIATQIVTTLRETLQIDLPLRVLLENATVLEVSESIEQFARGWEVDIHQVAKMVREVQQQSVCAGTSLNSVELAPNGNRGPEPK